MRQIILLDTAQGFGRRRIAGQYHQPATSAEEKPHRFESEAIHDVERSRTVGRTGIVAEIQIVILRKLRISLKDIAVILDDSKYTATLEILRRSISELDKV